MATMNYLRTIYLETSTKQSIISAEDLIELMDRVLIYKQTNVRDHYTWSHITDEAGFRGYKLLIDVGSRPGRQIIHTYKPIAE